VEESIKTGCGQREGTLSLNNKTDRRTDRQTDRQYEKVRNEMRRFNEDIEKEERCKSPI
jgi:hypothetical protein